jgi:CRP/FNR family transcriptional regulator
MKWKDAEQSTPRLQPSSDVSGAGFPAFAPIRSDAFESLRDLPDPVSIPAGTVIIEQDANCEFVWLLRSGLVRLCYVTPDGRETTLGLRTTGWFAGAVNALSSVPSVSSVKTLTPCLASRIPAKDFTAELAKSARLTRHLLSSLCCELLAQSSAQARLMSESAEERLATFMRERNRQFPQLKTVDALPLLKQRELAQLLSITPEHLSRLLHKSDTSTHADNPHWSHWLT